MALYMARNELEYRTQNGKLKTNRKNCHNLKLEKLFYHVNRGNKQKINKFNNVNRGSIKEDSMLRQNDNFA